jgi:L-malate glycosyltransferase
MTWTLAHLNTERGWRGGEAQTLRLVRGLHDRGHRCLLIGQPDGELLRRAAGEGSPTFPVAMRGELDLPAARRLARLVREEGVELLHYHTAHAVGLGALASLFCGRKPAVASRRVSFRLGGYLLGRFKYSWRVDRVVAVSEAIRRGLIAQGLAPGRVVVVHSGIDAERFGSGDGARFRASLRSLSPSLPEDAFLIGTVGHLAAHKGFDLFLEAAALAAAELPRARFVIVGRGEEETALRRLAGRLGLGDRVIFAGFRDDIPDVFAGFDLFVLSSRSGEGSPAVLKEAMASGVALAAPSLDGLEELVEDGRHGLLSPPGNAPALARSIVLMASDDRLRSRLSIAARERVGEFTSEKMVDSTEAVYRAVLEGR